MTAHDWRGTAIRTGMTVVATHGRSTAPFEAEVVELPANGRVIVDVLRHPKGADCGIDVVEVDPSRLVVVDWLPPASTPLLPALQAAHEARVLELASALVTHDFPPALVDGDVVDGWVDLPCQTCGLVRAEVSLPCSSGGSS